MEEIIWPGEFPELETERLLLRQVCLRDGPGIFSCFSSPETMRYLGTPLEEPDSVSGLVEEYRDGFSCGCSLIWTLEKKDSATFAGTAGFEQFSFMDHSAELGFTLLHEEQGAGLMTEALKALIDFGFSRMKINRIQASVLPENRGAVRLMEKLGFKREGCLKESVVFRGTAHHQLVLALLRGEWRRIG